MSTLSAFGFQLITSTDKPEHLSPSIFAPNDGIASEAFLTCEGRCRYRYDGQEPTATEGHLLTDGSYLKLKGELQIKNFIFIGLGTCTLQVSYERP